MVYNIEKQCIQLLDNGDHNNLENPMGMLRQYNFGSSPELLFKPCDYKGNSDADSCFVYELNGRIYSHAFDPIIRLPEKPAPRQGERSTKINSKIATDIPPPTPLHLSAPV